MDYEKETTYRKAEEDWIFEELVKENDNLKRLLLINHDFTHDIEDRLKAMELEEQEKKMKVFKLQRLKEEAERRLNESLSPQKKPLIGQDDSAENDSKDSKSEEFEGDKKTDSEENPDEDVDERDYNFEEDSDGEDNDEEDADGQEEMSQEIRLLVQKRMEETSSKKKPTKN